jgi:murein DD-endopeptidase MepM/ murein hydrolase activator NlpD
VHAGDRVRAGEAFAQLGNNGNSDLPHLHFQLMDSRNFALAQGLPFVFERFDLVGRIDPVTEKIVASGKPSARKNELPLTFSVVNFPIPRK